MDPGTPSRPPPLIKSPVGVFHPAYRSDISFQFRHNEATPSPSMAQYLSNTAGRTDDGGITKSFAVGKISSPRSCYRSTQYRPNENSPLQSPNDEVRSAAYALTSLSLSPANISGFDEGYPPKPYPPHNTPTDEDTILYSPRLLSHITDLSATESPYRYQQSDDHSPPLSPHPRSRTFSHNTPISEIFKPRSYTTTRHPPLERVSKQRSYSFDAFGRSHTYYNEEDQQPLRRSPPHMMSKDEGLGTSEGGSVESLETITSKRKLPQKRTGFRCMWRGCDKELSTLPAIILHVRHTHIGAARAGEEEFYFDDIKTSLPSTRFPSTSSNEGSFTETEQSSKISILTEDYPRQTSIFSMSLSPEITSPKRSKAVSVIQPVIPSADVRPREPFLPKGYDLPTNIDINQHQLSKMTGMNSDKKQRRRNKPIGKKKCRKVYGMSNKDLWCTQCRWKKACVRFL